MCEKAERLYVELLSSLSEDIDVKALGIKLLNTVNSVLMWAPLVALYEEGLTLAGRRGPAGAHEQGQC